MVWEFDSPLGHFWRINLSLTNEQCEFACKTFSHWMRICDENKRGSGWIDVDHSALLRRMLLGGQPHKNPPPLRMSYPAWELVEQEEIEIHELFELDDSLVIDQHQGYKWFDKENQIVLYTRLGIKYQYSERIVTPDIRCLRVGLNPEDHKYTGKFLKRLNDPSTGKEETWNRPKN